MCGEVPWVLCDDLGALLDEGEDVGFKLQNKLIAICL